MSATSDAATVTSRMAQTVMGPSRSVTARKGGEPHPSAVADEAANHNVNQVSTHAFSTLVVRAQHRRSSAANDTLRQRSRHARRTARRRYLRRDERRISARLLVV